MDGDGFVKHMDIKMLKGKDYIKIQSSEKLCHVDW
jgi:hypothetical protein